MTIPKGVQYVDVKKYSDANNNPKLAEFRVYSSRALMKEHLWLSSALRFFILEELMIEYNISSIIHIEADNLIYGRLNLALVSRLRLLAYLYKKLRLRETVDCHGVATFSVLTV